MMAVELLIRVVIAALAAYRTGRMLALETGPFALFSRWRGWVFIWQGKRHGNKKTWITEGVECPLCVGFWASLVMLGLTYVDYVAYLVVWLSVAGLQVALQKQERPELPDVFKVKIMEPENKGFVLESGQLWTGKWWEMLPVEEGKPIHELVEETRRLLASGMAAKDIIPYLKKRSMSNET